MTYPSFNAGEVLNASDMNAVGLWRVTTCTASFAGGTGGSVSNGVVTIGTNNTSITVNNAFSSLYDNYLIQVNGGVGSTNVEVSLRLGNTGNASHTWGLIYTTYATASAQAIRQQNVDFWQYVGRATTNTLTMACELRGPNLAKPTYMTANYAAEDAAGTIGGINTTTTQFTGFTIYPQLGNLTGGTIRVYGYNK